MIIGITGKKRNGKNTIADYICQNYDNFVQYSFAKSLKDLACILFDWNNDHVNGNLKEVVDERWGISPREFLQFMGTDVMQFALPHKFSEYKSKVGREHWVKLFDQWYRNNNQTNILIPDVRFLHEAKYIQEQNGIIIKVIRNSVNENIDLHLSEVEIDQINYDYAIDNDFDFDNLFSQVDWLMYNFDFDRLKTKTIDFNKKGE